MKTPKPIETHDEARPQNAVSESLPKSMTSEMQRKIEEVTDWAKALSSTYDDRHRMHRPGELHRV